MDDARGAVTTGPRAVRWFHALDAAVFHAIYRAVPKRLATITTHLGTHGGVWLLAAIGLLFDRARRPAGVQILLAIVVVNVINHVIKRWLIHRERPWKRFGLVMHDSLVPAWSQSFPSLHALYGFSCAWILAAITPSLTVPLFLLATAIGISRIAVGAHYPSDVAGGAVMGLLVGVGLTHAYPMT